MQYKVYGRVPDFSTFGHLRLELYPVACGANTDQRNAIKFGVQNTFVETYFHDAQRAFGDEAASRVRDMRAWRRRFDEDGRQPFTTKTLPVALSRESVRRLSGSHGCSGRTRRTLHVIRFRDGCPKSNATFHAARFVPQARARYQLRTVRPVVIPPPLLSFYHKQTRKKCFVFRISAAVFVTINTPRTGRFPALFYAFRCKLFIRYETFKIVAER